MLDLLWILLIVGAVVFAIRQHRRNRLRSEIIKERIEKDFELAKQGMTVSWGDVDEELKRRKK